MTMPVTLLSSTESFSYTRSGVSVVEISPLLLVTYRVGSALPT